MPSLNYLLRRLDFFMNPRKDIEVFGMYNATNLGDEAMRVAAINTIPNKRAVGVISDSSFSLHNRIKKKRARKELLVGGGTLIHGGNWQGRNKWLEYVELRRRQGARISVYGTGIAFTERQIEERSDSFCRWAAILEEATNVQLRGPLSQKAATAMGVEAEIFGDFVFSLFDPNIQKKEHIYSTKQKPIIGFNLGNCLGDQEYYEKINMHLIKELAKDFHIRFFIVTAKDLELNEKIIRKSKLDQSQYETFRIYLDPFSFMKNVICCEAFIGVKLHATGLAMICGVPTLSFEYLPKCRDFVMPIGLEHCLIQFPLDIVTIEKKIEELLKSPKVFSNIEKIEEFCLYQKKTITNRFSIS